MSELNSNSPSRERAPWLFRDNVGGAHPEVLAQLTFSNKLATEGQLGGYGNDSITRETSKIMKSIFSPTAETYIAPTGTFANILGCSLVGPFPLVICSRHSHLVTMEAGGPQKIAGVTFELLGGPEGKIAFDELERVPLGMLGRSTIVHCSLATEFGTVYSRDELKRIGEFCARHNVAFGIDGARLPHAALALGSSMRDLTLGIGADFVTLAAAKCGGLNGNALVVLDRDASRQKGIELLPDKRIFDLIKLRGGGPSHMWMVSTQFNALFGASVGEPLWISNVSVALERARVVDVGLGQLSIKPAFPIQTNAVFLRMNEDAQERFGQHWNFFRWLTDSRLVRLMFAYNTPAHYGEAILRDLSEINKSSPLGADSVSSEVQSPSA